MKKEDYKDFISNKQNCLRVGKAFLQFAKLDIQETDLADLTNLYANWLNYRDKLGDTLQAYRKKEMTLEGYTEKSKKLSIGKYNTMRNIVRFMDNHLNIGRMGSAPANTLYDELFGKGNWERQSMTEILDQL